MNKRNLYTLIQQVSQVAETLTPIIVGSQSLHALASLVPDIVRQSAECDFLFFGNLSAARSKVNQELGVFSEFQQEHGYWADALGLATVVLPSGWEERLQPLRDENGQTVALCVEIHDVAVSKLVAGREKDWVFLREAFWGEYLDLSTFTASALSDSVKVSPLPILAIAWEEKSTRPAKPLLAQASNKEKRNTTSPALET